MSPEAIRRTEEKIAAGRCRLIFVAPERLLTGRFLQFVERLNVGAFAIDEAHCISQWGHDFRPEYRRLEELKNHFPQTSLHAYTATATERVRADIAAQLRLTNPIVLVGTFDRPNLVYRVVPRVNARMQALEVLRRHPGQAAIVYCMTRNDTETMAAFLQGNGLRAGYYHAGMEADDRRRIQDAFASEQIDVVAATVAFGMGIDRSDVRCVIHAAMPKSIEHYQQETGRAGRDGLQAECVLLYSAADVLRWESLIEKSAVDAKEPADVIAASRVLLDHMRRLCSGVYCRHRKLSEYFGQNYTRSSCDACDVCLNEASREVLRGTRGVRLLQPKTKVRKTRFDEKSWESVDTGLFETLRNLRRKIASQRNVPAYVLFSDATLRDMARLRPGSQSALLGVRGVGDRKLGDLGERFLDEIRNYCHANRLPLDV
jgi:ATP-dependent DNA helicase RecQ